MARKMGIPIETILDLHNQGLYDQEIADILGCCRSNVTIRLKKAGVGSRRSKIDDLDLRSRISEKLIGRYCGEENPHYKGYTDEKTIARGIFKTFSKRKIRECNYTCAACGNRGGDLETHHIKPFNIIFHSFIRDAYDGNIHTIYDQLMNYSDFTDESNMVVLCRNCHENVHYSDNPELSPFRWESATTISKESRVQAIGTRSAEGPKGS